VLTAHKVEAVVHFAASALVGESMSQPTKYFRNNTVATLNLLDAMREAGVATIVFSSTCATYGDPVRVPIDETHQQVPVNPYGESKLMVEKILRWYGSAYGLKWMALRYFNAAGADPEGEIGEDHDPETHLIPLVIGAALGTRPPVKVFGTDYPTPDGSAVATTCTSWISPTRIDARGGSATALRARPSTSARTGTACGPCSRPSTASEGRRCRSKRRRGAPAIRRSWSPPRAARGTCSMVLPLRRARRHRRACLKWHAGRA
jgi:hypothetical protein